jgi:ABC-type methionine transport system permease subunit
MGFAALFPVHQAPIKGEASQPNPKWYSSKQCQMAPRRAFTFIILLVVLLVFACTILDER